MNGLNSTRNANIHASASALEGLKAKAKAARAQNHPNASEIERQYESLHKELAPQLKAAGYTVTE